MPKSNTKQAVHNYPQSVHVHTYLDHTYIVTPLTPFVSPNLNPEYYISYTNSYLIEQTKFSNSTSHLLIMANLIASKYVLVTHNHQTKPYNRQ